MVYYEAVRSAILATAWLRVKYFHHQTVCSQYYASVSGRSYVAQKCINFHLQPSRFEKHFSRRNPWTPAYKGKEGKEGEWNGKEWGREANKGFLSLGEGRERTEVGREMRRGEREGNGRDHGDLSPRS